MIVLPDDLPPLNAEIIRRAQLDVPIVENPPSSNSSPEIDAMCDRWAVPRRSYWCALWAASIWADAGAMVPPIDDHRGWHPAKAETWRQWALMEGLFSHEPIHGAAVLYGSLGHEPAHHIGVAIACVTPMLLAFEGNTSLAGYSRNGELATLKRVAADLVIGYVHPRAVS